MNRRLLLIVGATALCICGIGAVFDLPHFLRGYLLGWLFCLGMALGSVAMLMLNHMTGGGWGLTLRRPAEAAGATLWMLGLAFVPLALGASFVFPWADVNAVGHDTLLYHRDVFFRPVQTLSRSFLFLFLWAMFAWRLRQFSTLHDSSGEVRWIQRMNRTSVVGTILYFITMSIAAVDWIGSREVDWYSSTFGLALILGQGVSGMAFLILVVALIVDRSPARSLITERRLHDLGNLLQTLVVLWAYVSFAQYLVIWIGNSQEDNLWFYHRAHGGWGGVGAMLIVFHFGFPFVLLLFQSVKRSLRRLAWLAVGVLFMRAVDLCWMIDPSSTSDNPNGLNWMDPLMLVACAACWLAAFQWQLGRSALLPRAAIEEPIATERNHGASNEPTAA